MPVGRIPLRRLAALTVLVLAGCSQGYEATPEDIAADAAHDAVADSGLEDRIATLESRIEELESASKVQNSNIDTLFSNDNEIERFANETEDRVATVEVRLGI